MKTLVTTENLIDELRQIRAIEAKEAELRELRQQKESLFKTLLDEAGVQEMIIGPFQVRFQTIVKNSFSTSLFKKKYLELYNAFIKQSTYRKFSIV